MFGGGESALVRPVRLGKKKTPTRGFGLFGRKKSTGGFLFAVGGGGIGKFLGVGEWGRGVRDGVPPGGRGLAGFRRLLRGGGGGGWGGWGGGGGPGAGRGKPQALS